MGLVIGEYMNLFYRKFWMKLSILSMNFVLPRIRIFVNLLVLNSSYGDLARNLPISSWAVFYMQTDFMKKVDIV